MLKCVIYYKALDPLGIQNKFTKSSTYNFLIDICRYMNLYSYKNVFV